MVSPADCRPQSKYQKPLGFLSSWILDLAVKAHPLTGFADVLGCFWIEVSRWG